MSRELLAQIACDAIYGDFLIVVAVTNGANAKLGLLDEPMSTDMNELLYHREELRDQIGELASSGILPDKSVIFPKKIIQETI